MVGDMSSENQRDELRGSSDCNGKKQEKETFHSFSKMEGESLAKKKGFQENKAENQGKAVDLGVLEGRNSQGGFNEGEFNLRQSKEGKGATLVNASFKKV